MYSPHYGKGDTVNIYEDPHTEKKLEGAARLHKFLSVHGNLERWEVIFDDGVYQRWIKVH